MIFELSFTCRRSYVGVANSSTGNAVINGTSPFIIGTRCQPNQTADVQLVDRLDYGWEYRYCPSVWFLTISNPSSLLPIGSFKVGILELVYNILI